MNVIKVIKEINFWKKFLKNLAVGLSCMVILYFLQAHPTTLFAAACTPSIPQPATSINSPSNNQTFAIGTPNVTVSWNPINIDGETYIVKTTNTTTNTVMAAQSNPNYTGTSINIPVQNGNSYTVSVVPQNGCGGGSSTQVSFSISSTQTSCPNQGQCVTCGNDEDTYQVCPETSNNCTATCGGGTGQISCSISQYPQGNNLFTLIGNPSNMAQYNWDLDGNFTYNEAQGQTIARNFYTSTLVRLLVRDSIGNTGVCATTINPFTTSCDSTTPYYCPGTGMAIYKDPNNNCTYNYNLCSNQSGQCATDRNTCPDGSTVGRIPNNCSNFYACPNTGNQCRSAICSSLPAGCYYSVQPLTYTCDPNVQLTCGQITCNTNNGQPVNPGNNPIAFPSIPNPFGGNSQNTWVGVSNINNNENNNLNFSNSFSDSWASGGGGGSSNITINW